MNKDSISETQNFKFLNAQFCVFTESIFDFTHMDEVTAEEILLSIDCSFFNKNWESAFVSELVSEIMGRIFGWMFVRHSEGCL